MKVETITAKGILVNVRVRMWGAGAKVDDNKLGNLPTDIVKATQSLLLDEDKEIFDQIKSVKSETNLYIKNRSLNFPIDGFHMIAKDIILETNDFLKKKEVKFFKLVGLASNKLEQIKKNYNKKHPNFYRPERYPTKKQFENLFSFSWSFRSLQPDDSLKEIDTKLYNEEQKRFVNELREMENDTIKLISTEIINRITNLKDMTMGKKRLNQGTINGINDLMEKWDNLWNGFISHKELKKVINTIKKEVVGLEADDLRFDRKAKKQLKNITKDIISSINNVDEIKGNRMLIY